MLKENIKEIKKFLKKITQLTTKTRSQPNTIYTNKLFSNGVVV